MSYYVPFEGSLTSKVTSDVANSSNCISLSYTLYIVKGRIQDSSGSYKVWKFIVKMPRKQSQLIALIPRSSPMANDVINYIKLAWFEKRLISSRYSFDNILLVHAPESNWDTPAREEAYMQDALVELQVLLHLPFEQLYGRGGFSCDTQEDPELDSGNVIFKSKINVYFKGRTMYRTTAATATRTTHQQLRNNQSLLKKWVKS